VVLSIVVLRVAARRHDCGRDRPGVIEAKAGQPLTVKSTLLPKNIQNAIGIQTNNG
jgi:hypothetical protein